MNDAIKAAIRKVFPSWDDNQIQNFITELVAKELDYYENSPPKTEREICVFCKGAGFYLNGDGDEKECPDCGGTGLD